VVTYPSSAIVSKEGLNYVRSLVEAGGCLFHKIEQESDLGIDALIELVKGGKPACTQVAAQIKSGDSYFDTATETVSIPVGSHRDYWTHYPLPVLGIVYVPSLTKAYWGDVKKALRASPEARELVFPATEANLLDSTSFDSLFVPTLLRQVPAIPRETAVSLARSVKPQEAALGLLVLFRKFPNSHDNWDAHLDYLLTKPLDDLSATIIYRLAHIPWHGDIAYAGELLTDATREYAGALLKNLQRHDVLKLLAAIDPENGIARGTTGQSVEAILSFLPTVDVTLTDIVADDRVPLPVREFAATILAMHQGTGALSSLDRLATERSWFASELARVIREFGGINPYG
jgi:hypothetical protein